jgi:chromosome segregation ATPase
LPVRKRAKELRAQAYKDRDVMTAIFEEASEEDRQKIANLPREKTVADVEDDIETERARLDLIHEGNPNAIKQYEDRKVQIDNLRTKITNLEGTLEKQNTAIREVQEVWEPELDALIAKISTAFSKEFRKIGCAGEVRIFKSDEGFDKWAAEILVKFREGEKFQVLDNYRQSGGERAVTTVFYLMALQSMAKSPFRVVDEINQGMDPRNERAVHHRMVNIACQENTSQ